ncbi:O-methylpimelyl-ACP methylesterase [Lysobacter helvus]|uniref:O-methylpimelyl-ACP methylesterase n=2 Tax=Lysobacteraceae TaxID=32033 RepID=A0ABM7Q6Z4_9GAMM|nr:MULTISPECIES: alpha/beta hydrolase [Lysobacter]BCT93146.1 O-methylpimelyl-ACP methylesterase [Lysobacter caseinilyticus]BCT96298.1 O-methylpimelyl-ACP methylesterase [Lysobacter helvus]
MTEGLITVRDGSSIFHRDVGSGPAVVMVPAWSMTADAFSHQVGHLGQNYRVIALDPRGQGRSSTTLEGNDYVTHAHDLHDVVQHLGLTRFALVGWSNGALAAAHYVDIYGVDLLWALVDIDMPALAVPKAPGDWAEVPCLDAFQGFLGPLTVDPEAFRRQMVRFFVERDLSDEEERWLLAQMHSQPPFVGRLLLSDILFYDFAEMLSRVSVATPTLVAVKSAWARDAEDWVRRTCPDAEFAAFNGGHMFFWEDPEPFNAVLKHFLDDAIQRIAHYA